MGAARRQEPPAQGHEQVTTAKIYKLLCDEAGCVASFTHHGEFVASDARKAAAQIGWISFVERRTDKTGPVKTIDLCSTHAKERNRRP